MRETRSSGSVEGVISDGHSYSDFDFFSTYTSNEGRRDRQAQHFSCEINCKVVMGTFGNGPKRSGLHSQETEAAITGAS
jgi:hypothetical protein